MSRRTLIVFIIIVAIAGSGLVLLAAELGDPGERPLIAWWRGNEATRRALSIVRREPCPGAPFILPADGYVGLLYGDPRGPYSQERPHQGIDIFSEGAPGETPVYAAYDGYITRESDWKSTLIQRVPQDPLQPDRQIWLYYTHMADESGETDFIEPAFPAGTREFFVEQGTLLGYTGNYSGSPLRTVWTHLHFSIVADDGQGHYRNELQYENTFDPTPYLNIEVGHADGEAVAPSGCREN